MARRKIAEKIYNVVDFKIFIRKGGIGILSYGVLTLVLMLTNLELRVPCAILTLERELGLPSS